MQTRRLVLLVGLLFGMGIAAPSAAEEKKAHPEIPAEAAKVLEQWVGSWQSDCTYKPSVWMPQGGKLAGTHTTEWVLDGRFIQSKGVGQDGKFGSLLIMTFDPHKKTYRSWWFDSTGYAVESTGQWEEDSKTLVMKAVDANTGIQSVITTRVIDKDNYQWTGVWKDKEGKVLLDMESKVTRRK